MLNNGNENNNNGNENNNNNNNTATVFSIWIFLSRQLLRPFVRPSDQPTR